MSREIKFRVFVRGEMLNATGMNFLYKHSHTDGNCISLFKDVEPMQYTGLKDCSKIDIYEGDIVQATIGDKLRYEIVFYGGCFCLAGMSNLPLQINGMSHIGHIEVVGNIHENPELLEKQ